MIIPYTLKNLGLNKVCLWGFPGGASGKKNLPTSAGNVRHRFDPGSGRSHGEGNGNPLQYSCWRSPWAGETGRLWSIEFQRVGHN